MTALFSANIKRRLRLIRAADQAIRMRLKKVRRHPAFAAEREMLLQAQSKLQAIGNLPVSRRKPPQFEGNSTLLFEI